MNYRQDAKYRRMVSAECSAKWRKEEAAKAAKATISAILEAATQNKQPSSPDSQNVQANNP